MASIGRRSGKSRTRGVRRKVVLGIRDCRVPIHSHISYLWTNPNEFAEVAGFLEEGLRGHDTCLLIGSKDTVGRILGLLAERGFDVEALKATGRLTQLGGARSAEAMLDTYAAALERAVEAGAPLVRLWAYRRGVMRNGPTTNRCCRSRSRGALWPAGTRRSSSVDTTYARCPEPPSIAPASGHTPCC